MKRHRKITTGEIHRYKSIMQKISAMYGHDLNTELCDCYEIGNISKWMNINCSICKSSISIRFSKYNDLNYEVFIGGEFANSNDVKSYCLKYRSLY